MWTELRTEEELAAFIRLVCGFHDSVLKDLSYVSGAYVDEKLNMYPVDDKACLRVLIQRQDETLPELELEFSGLQELRLYPTDPAYTSEILDAALFLWDELICWCDCGDIGPEKFDDYRGTSVRAKSLRWRPVAGEQEKQGDYSVIPTDRAFNGRKNIEVDGKVYYRSYKIER